MFGTRLKQLRMKNQLTLAKFGKKIEMGGASIYYYETERRKPGFGLLKKLHETYRVNLNWLISGNGEMEVKQ